MTGISDGLKVGLEVEGARVGLLVGLIVGERVVGKSEGVIVEYVGALVLKVGESEGTVLEVGKYVDDDGGSLSVGS